MPKLTRDKIDQLRSYLEEILGITVRSRLIESIDVNSAFHWQPPLHIQVGSRCGNLEKDSPSEEIVAIFESTTFLVCTPRRGAFQGLPYFFSKEDVHRVTEMSR